MQNDVEPSEMASLWWRLATALKETFYHLRLQNVQNSKALENSVSFLRSSFDHFDLPSPLKLDKQSTNLYFFLSCL